MFLIRFSLLQAPSTPALIPHPPFLFPADAGGRGEMRGDRIRLLHPESEAEAEAILSEADREIEQ